MPDRFFTHTTLDRVCVSFRLFHNLSRDTQRQSEPEGLHPLSYVFKAFHDFYFLRAVLFAFAAPFTIRGEKGRIKTADGRRVLLYPGKAAD